jgi:hypothetical protein
MVAFLRRSLLSLGCVLFLVSGLSAQQVTPEEDSKSLNEFFKRQDEKRVAEVRRLQEFQRMQTSLKEMVWWFPILICGVIVAIGGILKYFTKPDNSPQESPPDFFNKMPRTQDLGLGADGKGGVWRRTRGYSS